MEYLIFKTDINTEEGLKTIDQLLSDHPLVADWSLDMEDSDNVLKIKPSGSLEESDIMQYVNAKGLSCELLPD